MVVPTKVVPTKVVLEGMLAERDAQVAALQAQLAAQKKTSTFDEDLATLATKLGEPLVTHGRGDLNVALHNLPGGAYVVVATEGMIVREIRRVADSDEGQ
jgi:hypothetical protein